MTRRFTRSSKRWTGLKSSWGKQRYLAGDRITEADWRAFTTLVRFDKVYHLHFKCNRNRVIDYPNLWAYTGSYTSGPVSRRP